MLLNICNNPDILSVMRLIIISFNIIKIVVPLVIILLLIIDYSKIITKGDGIKENNINASKRIIASLMIFLIPTTIQLLAELTVNDFEYSKCISNATTEGINNAYRKKINEHISKASLSLSKEDYEKAVTYSKQIKDQELKKETEEKLSKLKKKVDIYNDIGSLYTSDKIVNSSTHNVPYYIKINSEKDIYYCIDISNTCTPKQKYTNQIWFNENGTKYLRYKLCTKNNECSKISVYESVIKQKLSRPNVSTSWGGEANPHQAAYYYQCDSRWKNYDVNQGIVMCDVGCGYNAYAMIMTGITHDYSITPATLFKKLSEIKKEHGIEFQSLTTGGGLLNEAIHTNNYLKKEYGYESSELWNDYKYTTSEQEKKEKLTESLKMGHMIFIRVPIHFIALVGIDEKENIYVYDPGWKSWKLDIDTFYNTYYDYNNNCTYGKECGMKIAYEVYTTGGTSLDTWRKK